MYDFSINLFQSLVAISETRGQKYFTPAKKVKLNDSKIPIFPEVAKRNCTRRIMHARGQTHKEAHTHNFIIMLDKRDKIYTSTNTKHFSFGLGV